MGAFLSSKVLKVKAIKEATKIIEESKSKGPAPSFSFFDILNALEVIWRSKAIGRKKLSDEIELGEGSIRTIIKLLKKLGLIEASELGCKLTRKGTRLIRYLNSKIGPALPLSKSFLAVGEANFGVLVKKAGFKVKNGIKQRDAAIKLGADAATTLIFKKEGLILPPMNKLLNEEWPNLAKEVYQAFQPKENDVIIICSAKNKSLAKRGAKAAAWSLIEEEFKKK
jgi:predicted transcriptional regulator